MNKTYLLSASASYTAGTILVVADSLDEIREMVQEYLDETFEALKQYIYSVENSNNIHEWTIPYKEREKIKEKINAKYPFICNISTGMDDYYLGWLVRKWRLKEFQSDLRGKDGWYVEKEFYSDLSKGFHYVIDYCA